MTGYEARMPRVTDDVEQRARSLLSQMTLNERLAMMDGDLLLYPGMLALTRDDYYHHKPFPAGQNLRLGIEGVRFIDGPRGIVLYGGATAFPVSMARGATFDPALETRIGDAIGKELRSHGGNLFGGVCVNLLRHPAWGRAQETYGEDPLLLGAMGSALVAGVQRHGLACVKHLAANSMENQRFHVDVTMSPRVLHEMYLPHFKACVDAGAAVVMSAYNAVNGEWCGQSRALLTEVLRERWGFDGFVITDFVFGLRDAERGALAGQDIEMPFRFVYRDKLKDAVSSGRVPESTIDRSVLRILRKLLALPEGEYPPSLRACPEHIALAREVAAKTMVLLKNDGDVLPVRPDETVALFGELAAVPNLGDRGSSDGRPEYVVTPLQGLRAALRERLVYDEGGDLDRARETARAADVAIVVVGYTAADEGESIAPPSLDGFVHLFPPPPPLDRLLRGRTARRLFTRVVDAVSRRILRYTRAAFDRVDASFGAGGDRRSLRLSPRHVALIRAVAEANPRTVVAIMAGSAVVVSEWQGLVPGILMLWYPGMEGGNAFADVVQGVTNPSGKLPFVVPSDESHLPMFDASATAIEYDLWHGYRKLDRDGVVAAFPFGFGLSYTQFAYSLLRLETTELSPADTLRVSLDVENTGARAGDEIVQLYVSVEASSVERAPKALAGFTKVSLDAGERRRVELEVPLSRLAYFDEEVDDFIVETTRYRVIVGRHAGDESALTATFSVSDQASVSPDISA